MGTAASAAAAPAPAPADEPRWASWLVVGALLAYLAFCVTWPVIRNYVWGPLEHSTWADAPFEIWAGYYLWVALRAPFRAAAAVWRWLVQPGRGGGEAARRGGELEPLVEGEASAGSLAGGALLRRTAF